LAGTRAEAAAGGSSRVLGGAGTFVTGHPGGTGWCKVDPGGGEERTSERRRDQSASGGAARMEDRTIYAESELYKGRLSEGVRVQGVSSGAERGTNGGEGQRRVPKSEVRGKLHGSDPRRPRHFLLLPARRAAGQRRECGGAERPEDRIHHGSRR